MASQTYFLAGQFPLLVNLLKWSVWTLLQARRSQGERAVAFRLVSLIVTYHALEAFLNEAADLCLRSSKNLSEGEKLCLSEKAKNKKGELKDRYLSIEKKLEKWPPILGKSHGVRCNILADKDIRDTFEKLHRVRNALVHPRQREVEQVLLSDLRPQREVPLELLPTPFPKYLELITPEQAIRCVIGIVEKCFQAIGWKMTNSLKGAFQNIQRDLESS